MVVLHGEVSGGAIVQEALVRIIAMSESLHEIVSAMFSTLHFRVETSQRY